MTERDSSRNDLPLRLSPGWKEIGVIVHVLLPSVKMKAKPKGNRSNEQEFHDFLISRFDGYTVTGGNITGYWMNQRKAEECNEHREYQIAVSKPSHLDSLQSYLAELARRLEERTVFCTIQGSAFLVKAAKTR